MICNQCGFQLKEPAKFCPRCGSPVILPQNTPNTPPQNISMPPFPETPPRKEKKQAAIGFAVLSLVLAAILILQNLGIVGLVAGSSGSRSGALEGKGYASAEEAVEAYVEALKRGDVPAILSTFAIETYIDNYDTEAGLSRIGAWIPAALSDSAYQLIGSDYERQLMLYSRQASISHGLYRQLLTYSAFLSDMIDSFDLGGPITFEDEENIEEFLRIYRKSPFGKLLAEMEIEEFVDPKDLNEAYGSEANLKNMREQGKIFGCEEYKSVAARVSLNGESWLLTMDCARYNGRWYNLTPSGTLSVLLDANFYQYGLLPYSAVEW